MKYLPLSHVLWIGLACTAAAPLVQADAWNKRTIVTFHQAVEIPRVVLGPGTYVIKVVDNLSNRDIVQFLNERENHVFATVLAIPDFEPNGAKDHTAFTFEERAANAPQALKTWFYPGDDYGEEFVYPKIETPAPSTAPPPAELTPRPASPEPRSEAQPAPASAPVIAQNSTPTTPPAPQQPVEVVQAQPAPTPTPAHSEPVQELPHTASTLSLIALMGMFSTTCALGLRASANLFKKS